MAPPTSGRYVGGALSACSGVQVLLGATCPATPLKRRLSSASVCNARGTEGTLVSSRHDLGRAPAGTGGGGGDRYGCERDLRHARAVAGEAGHGRVLCGALHRARYPFL